MRGLIGGIILVVGVGGLGWYAAQGPAEAMQAQIADDASGIAGGAQHAVAVAVSGRDLTVTGSVEDDAELASLQAAFDGIAGRRVVNMDGVTPLPVISPYTLNIAQAVGSVLVDGYAPSQAVRDALGFDGLEIANGEPDAAWADAVTTAAAALQNLKSGALTFSDQQITVTGLAATPTELAAFNDQMMQVPAGYTVVRTIEVEDDGSPLRLSLRYDGTTLSGSGKIPSDMALDAVSIDGRDTELDLQEATIASADGEWPAFAKAAITALGALQDGMVEIESQTMMLTGTASPDGITAATAALTDVPDGYTANTDITLFDDGAPFTLSATKTAEGTTAIGKVPADFDASMTAGLLDDAALGDIDIAFITDPEGIWPGIAQAGMAALAALEEGTLMITDTGLALSGAAALPDDRATALAALDGTVDVTTDITLLDDGTPIAVTLTYDVDTGLQLSGKLPADVVLADVAETLDMEVADAGITQARASNAFDMLAPLAAIQRFLPELAGLTYTASQDATAITAVTVPGVDADLIASDMQAALGAAVDVAVQPRTDLPATGATRVNRFSGREEVFTSGYWLPTFDFFATPESCAAQSDTVLSTDQVRFVTGSAELDVPSIRAINALAALTRKCALEGGVFLHVEGHTDNTGDADANLALSQARADTVRVAILDRGVAQVVVTAIGFGDTQPIADNETEEGRAANRRTTFNWNFE